MRLHSIIANRHIFDGQVNGKPFRLLLRFSCHRSLRLRIAGDGEQMLVDDGNLDPPLDIGECGHIDLADVTEPLFPMLRGLEVKSVEALILNGKRVGLKLKGSGGEQFHFWSDGDDLHWGDEVAFFSHDWLGQVAPVAMECIQI